MSIRTQEGCQTLMNFYLKLLQRIYFTIDSKKAFLQEWLYPICMSFHITKLPELIKIGILHRRKIDPCLRIPKVLALLGSCNSG